MSRQEEMNIIARKMQFLFDLPIEMMNDSIVKQYNILEERWQALNNRETKQSSRSTIIIT